MTAQTTYTPVDGLPSAAQCAPIAVLALRILHDLRGWAEEHPAILRAVPAEAMSLTAATVSPWRGAVELRPAARMCVWTYALDDHVEWNITGLDELDDLFSRCNAVVRTGQRDDSQPLVSALSAWQHELVGQPLYPALSELWIEKFDRALRGMRYDWLAGRAREDGHDPTDVQEYLAHANSVLVWMTHFPRWITYGRRDLLEQLDVLVPALDDVKVAVRLANDLATFSWERNQPGQNNILFYGASPDWVRAELARRTESAKRRLTPLAAACFGPAVELIRLLEWSVCFYSLTDFRGWGSDAFPHTATGRSKRDT